MARPCRHLFAPGQVAMKHPSAVTACNLDLENLVTDANRSIATLAITTLLKTGSEGSIDRLMKQISSFMSEISDEFKVHRLRPLRGGPRGGAVRGAAPGLRRRGGRLQACQALCCVPCARCLVLGKAWRGEQSSSQAGLPSELAFWGGTTGADSGVDGIVPHAGAARRPSGQQFPGEPPGRTWEGPARACVRLP